MTPSLLFSSLWDSIAPNPSFDASVVNSNGFVKSGFLNIGASVNFFLSISNAFCYRSLHSNLIFFFTNLCSGFAILANSGTNFL